MQNEMTYEEVIKMIESEITEKDLEHLYIFLDEMYDKLSDNEQLAIAMALEKIDKGFYDEE